MSQQHGLPAEVDIYIDGVESALSTTNVATSVSQSTIAPVIGAYYSGINSANSTYTMNGAVKYLYAWDRALTPDEIQSLYLDPYQAFRPKRRAYYIPSGTPVYRYLGPYGTLSYYRIN